MSAKSIVIVAVFILVTAIMSFKVAGSLERMSQKSAVASPTAAMLREIVEEMKSGNHERALRMTERLERGLNDYLHDRGPTPERFIGEVYRAE